MARTRNSRRTLTKERLRILEGKLQEMRGQSSDQRPKMLPVDFLARELAVSRVTVQEWVRSSRSRGATREEVEHFTELFDAFSQVMAEEPVKALYEAAYKPSQGQVAALKWLLPKIDPVMWGDKVESVKNGSGEIGVADVPREVLDDLTEEELLQIEQYQTEIEERMRATAQIVNAAKARVAQRVATQH